jgi:hypothetical protein
VYIIYEMAVSEKFKSIGNLYNITMIFRKKHALRSSLMRIRPQRDPQQTAQYVYSTPFECDRYYIGETGRPLAVPLCELTYNWKEVLLDTFKLAQHE